MTRLKLAVVLLFLFSVGTTAQTEYEYGQPSDMKGLTKIYIDTKGNIKDRETIVKEFEKGKIGVQAVDSKDLAEIIIDFNTTESKQAVARTITNTYDPKYSVNVVSNVKVVSGEAMVTIKGQTTSNRRVVMNFNGGRKDPAAAFAKEFIKAYRTANGIKKG